MCDLTKTQKSSTGSPAYFQSFEDFIGGKFSLKIYQKILYHLFNILHIMLGSLQLCDRLRSLQLLICEKVRSIYKSGKTYLELQVPSAVVDLSVQRLGYSGITHNLLS